MASVAKTYDVFISHNATDVAVAKQIAETLRANGIEAIAQTEIPLGESFSDSIWEALAESRALLVIVSESEPSPSVAVELGAAWAWNKPVFGVLTGKAVGRLPAGFKDVQFFPSNRIDDVIRTVKLGVNELTDVDRDALVSIYAEQGIPVDQLTLDSKARDALVKDFRTATGKSVAGEKLLSELLRLRKSGKLRRKSA